MRSISEISENLCFGCTACSAICPHGSIKMVQSVKGFYIPELNKAKCTECGLCLKSCPAASREVKTRADSCEVKSYAIRHKSDKIRFLSSSGGAFTAIVETFSNNPDCIVYGAAFKDGVVKHIRVNVNNIDRLRKSKYVQSELGDAFPCIYNDLKEGRKVLFCGTPCQCAGLSEYLSIRKCNTDNLLIIDFICHGTLSPRVFSEFLKYCEGKRRSKIVDYCFRVKDKGWHSYIGINTFDNGYVDSTSFTSQLFTSLYYTNFSFKESCYTCKYTSKTRVSDITLADFWGIEKHLPEFDDNKGVSFVMFNTEKGQKVFERINTVESIAVPLEYTEQPHLYHPVSRPSANDEFWRYLNKNGFHRMAIKYLKAGKIRRTASKMLRTALKFVK